MIWGEGRSTKSTESHAPKRLQVRNHEKSIFLGKRGELTKMRSGGTQNLWQERDLLGLTINNLSQ